MRTIAAILGVLITVAYPAAVYVGLSRFEPRGIALVLLLFFLPSLALRAKGPRREHLRALLPLPIAIVSLLLLTVFFNDDRFVRYLPVAINLVFLAAFGLSLRTATSLIEHYARLTDPSLGMEKQRYCRTVTLVWCFFFAINGAASAILAAYAPIGWWSLYTGFIAYIMMGALFATEYVVRKYRFRDYGHTFPDRLLARLFPPV